MVKIESFPTEILKAIYEAFERIAPVRVLMKVAKKEELPPGLPKNVLISSWLPQTRVLRKSLSLVLFYDSKALSLQASSKSDNKNIILSQETILTSL